MKVLILEDDIIRIHEFRKRFVGLTTPVFVDTAVEAIDLIKKDSWDVICLDHDLGGEVYVSTDYANTGSTVAKYLAANPVSATIFIHSLNTPAAIYMSEILAERHRVAIVPFLWTKNIFDKWQRFMV